MREVSIPRWQAGPRHAGDRRLGGGQLNIRHRHRAGSPLTVCAAVGRSTRPIVGLDLLRDSAPVRASVTSDLGVTRRRRLLDLLAERDPPVDDAADAIAEFRVLVDGSIMTNPNSMVRSDARVVVRQRTQPQGARKLGHALDRLAVEVDGRVAVDIGACTGGFTVALLERGAARVFAVDVGFGQLLGSLQQDTRVISLERTNVADVTPLILGLRPDLIVADVTKLTLRDAAKQLAENDVPKPGTEFVGLVKPMFELATGELPNEPAELERAVQLAATGIAACGWDVLAAVESDVRGHNGAVEFFVHARWVAG